MYSLIPGPLLLESMRALDVNFDGNWKFSASNHSSLFLLSLGNRFRKTRGLGAGRKLRTHRREQLWADKDYKKSNLGSEWKKPFAGSSHAKGIVLEKIGIEAKQPNSAIRKCGNAYSATACISIASLGIS